MSTAEVTWFILRAQVDAVALFGFAQGACFKIQQKLALDQRLIGQQCRIDRMAGVLCFNKAFFWKTKDITLENEGVSPL